MEGLTIHQLLDLQLMEVELHKLTKDKLVESILLQKQCQILLDNEYQRSIGMLKDFIGVLMIGELQARHDAEQDMHDSDEMAEWGFDG